MHIRRTDSFRKEVFCRWIPFYRIEKIARTLYDTERHNMEKNKKFDLFWPFSWGIVQIIIRAVHIRETCRFIHINPEAIKRYFIVKFANVIFPPMLSLKNSHFP